MFTEGLSQHRWLQLLADRAFQAADTGESEFPFQYVDIKREAAFRSWLRCVDVHDKPPCCLPDERALDVLAMQWDLDYGSISWWAWPAWSTCPYCAQGGVVQCQQCWDLLQFAAPWIYSTEEGYEDGSGAWDWANSPSEETDVAETRSERV